MLQMEEQLKRRLKMQQEKLKELDREGNGRKEDPKKELLDKIGNKVMAESGTSGLLHYNNTAGPKADARERNPHSNKEARSKHPPRPQQLHICRVCLTTTTKHPGQDISRYKS